MSKKTVRPQTAGAGATTTSASTKTGYRPHSANPTATQEGRISTGAFQQVMALDEREKEIRSDIATLEQQRRILKDANFRHITSRLERYRDLLSRISQEFAHSEDRSTDNQIENIADLLSNKNDLGDIITQIETASRRSSNPPTPNSSGTTSQSPSYISFIENSDILKNISIVDLLSAIQNDSSANFDLEVVEQVFEGLNKRCQDVLDNLIEKGIESEGLRSKIEKIAKEKKELEELLAGLISQDDLTQDLKRKRQDEERTQEEFARMQAELSSLRGENESLRKQQRSSSASSDELVASLDASLAHSHRLKHILNALGIENDDDLKKILKDKRERDESFAALEEDDYSFSHNSDGDEYMEVVGEGDVVDDDDGYLDVNPEEDEREVEGDGVSYKERVETIIYRINQIRDNEDELKQARDAAQATAAQAQADAQERVAQAEAQLDELKQARDSAQTTATQAEARAQQEQERANRAEANAQTARQERDKLQQKNQGLSGQLQTLRQDLEQARQTAQQSQQTTTEQQARIATLQAQLEDVAKARDSAQATAAQAQADAQERVAQAEERAQQEQARATQAEERLQAAEANLREIEGQNAGLREQQQRLESELDNLRQQKAKAEEAAQASKGQLEELSSALQQQKQERAIAQQQLADLQQKPQTESTSVQTEEYDVNLASTASTSDENSERDSDSGDDSKPEQSSQESRAAQTTQGQQRQQRRRRFRSPQTDMLDLQNANDRLNEEVEQLQFELGNVRSMMSQATASSGSDRLSRIEEMLAKLLDGFESGRFTQSQRATYPAHHRMRPSHQHLRRDADSHYSSSSSSTSSSDSDSNRTNPPTSQYGRGPASNRPAFRGYVRDTHHHHHYYSRQSDNLLREINEIRNLLDQRLSAINLSQQDQQSTTTQTHQQQTTPAQQPNQQAGPAQQTTDGQNQDLSAIRQNITDLQQNLTQIQDQIAALSNLQPQQAQPIIVQPAQPTQPQTAQPAQAQSQTDISGLISDLRQELGQQLRELRTTLTDSQRGNDNQDLLRVLQEQGHHFSELQRQMQQQFGYMFRDNQDFNQALLGQMKRNLHDLRGRDYSDDGRSSDGEHSKTTKESREEIERLRAELEKLRAKMEKSKESASTKNQQNIGSTQNTEEDKQQQQPSATKTEQRKEEEKKETGEKPDSNDKPETTKSQQPEIKEKKLSDQDIKIALRDAANILFANTIAREQEMDKSDEYLGGEERKTIDSRGVGRERAILRSIIKAFEKNELKYSRGSKEHFGRIGKDDDYKLNPNDRIDEVDKPFDTNGRRKQGYASAAAISSIILFADNLARTNGRTGLLNGMDENDVKRLTTNMAGAVSDDDNKLRKQLFEEAKIYIKENLMEKEGEKSILKDFQERNYKPQPRVEKPNGKNLDSFRSTVRDAAAAGRSA